MARIGGWGARVASAYQNFPIFFALVFGICHTNRRISIIWIVSGKNHQKIEFFEDPGKIARMIGDRGCVSSENAVFNGACSL
jgi:hypothetical protein